jgi:hypothetical protein
MCKSSFCQENDCNILFGCSRIGNGKPLTSDVVVDETWFSDAVFGEKLKVCAYVKFLLLIISLQVILLTLSL